MDKTENKRDAIGDTKRGVLWCTSDFSLQEFKQTGKLETCHVAIPDLDMTGNGWTKVGEVEILITALTTGEELVMQEIRSLQSQIEKEKKDSAGRIAWLEDKLANLRCLPAPKNEEPIDPCEWSEE